MIPGLTPSDLGLPKKFEKWRTGQTLALNRGMESVKTFLAHSMPVGEGKSLYYITQALVASERACVLTASKGLQSQLLGDFSDVGLVDMRGRNNYTCRNKEAKSCEEGQHYRCNPGDCPYEQARNRMLSSNLVVTNYSYFMLSYMYGRGMGEFDLLICDEAHDLPDEVCSAVAVEFAYWEANKIGMKFPPSDSMEEWQVWAAELVFKANGKLEELRLVGEEEKLNAGRIHPQTSKEISAWTKIMNKGESVVSAIGEWVVDRTGEGFRLEPVWAKDYARSVLFRQIPKVVLVSATMVKKTLNLMGIAPEEVDYYEYSSSFPAKRSPVYLFGGSTRIDHRTPPEHMDVWVSKIDNIIRYRKDRKGIIHSVSYDRARFIRDKSEFSYLMIVPEKGKDTAECIERFKKSLAPAVLISPAITTGYDFPGEECEYNIIAKVPFLDARGKVISIRQKQDPEYPPYITAQTIVQAHGRSMRGEWDQSETFIIDAHIDWFIRKHRNLFPFWFHRLVLKPSGMPEPPAPLSKKAGNLKPLTQNERTRKNA